MGKNDIPYGSYEEYDYMISLIVSTATNSFTEGGKPTRHMNFLSNILNTASLESSPDFTENLKGKNTPPVLVVQPEFGIVPWQIHYQYGEYFDNVKFVTAPKSGHDVWKTEIGKDILVRNGDALFRGEVIPVNTRLQKTFSAYKWCSKKITAWFVERFIISYDWNS